MLGNPDPNPYKSRFRPSTSDELLLRDDLLISKSSLYGAELIFVGVRVAGGGGSEGSLVTLANPRSDGGLCRIWYPFRVPSIEN